MSEISLIAAMSENRVIGRDNKLPWHYKSDLTNFKKLTLDKPVIMGRKTFESLPNPLPNRTNIVITRDKFYSPNGVTVFQSVDDAIDFAKNLRPPAKEIMIIGGEQIFEATLETANRMYITLIKHFVEGDAHFPEYSQNIWQKKSSLDLEPDVEFSVYEKIKAA